MADILPRPIEDYLLELHPPADPVRAAMEELARARRFPIVGPLVGRLCAVVAASLAARRVFELGSGFGYSALWFASAMGEDGVLTLTERSPQLCAMARDHLRRAGARTRVRILEGDALDLLEACSEPQDLIFCDADKEQYPAALDLAVERLRPGGILMADNVLWGGSVAGPEASRPDPALAGILEFNRRAFAHPRLRTTILPLRDGVSLSVLLDREG